LEDAFAASCSAKGLPIQGESMNRISELFTQLDEASENAGLGDDSSLASKHPELREAEDAWSECMAKSDHEFETVKDASQSISTQFDKLSGNEIADPGLIPSDGGAEPPADEANPDPAAAPVDETGSDSDGGDAPSIEEAAQAIEDFSFDGGFDPEKMDMTKLHKLQKEELELAQQDHDCQAATLPAGVCRGSPGGRAKGHRRQRRRGDGAQKGHGRQGRRLMRPSRVALTAGAVAVLCGGVGFVLGRTIESPADAAAGAKAPKASLIGAPVEFEQLSANLVVRGTIGAVGATQMTLAASKIGKTDNIVVRAAERGATINEGDVFAVIGDRPVIVLQGDLPVYRDLQPGNQGEDVLLLENALARLDLDPGDVDGTYDSSTEGAVSRLYENRGFKAIGPTAEEQARIDDLTKQESTARAAGNAADASKASEDLGKLLDSTGPSVPANELIFASVLPAKVESVNVKRGSTVDGPIATLASSESVVQTSIARADRNLVEVGAAAKIDITDLGQTIDGKVLTIAPQTGTDGAGESRYAVTVQSADIPQDSLGLGVRITIPRQVDRWRGARGAGGGVDHRRGRRRVGGCHRRFG
jgi:HlyD family secretion protein